VLDASLLPAVTTANGTYFHLADTVLPAEKIKVTNISGLTLTVTRGDESTTPVSHGQGATYGLVITAGDFAKFGQGQALATSQGLHPANPSATSSVSLVMMGLGATLAFTPASTGIVLVSMSGTAQIATGVQTITLGGRYGTGTAPVNGAAASGSRFGASADQSLKPAAVASGVAWALTDVLSLVAGTAYWFDIALATGNASDAASLQTIGCSLVELLA